MRKLYKWMEPSYQKRKLKIESELGGDNPVSYRSSRESMSKGLLGLRRGSVLFAFVAFLLILFSSTVYAACVTPTRGMTITKDTTFCSGTYNFNGLDSGVIVIGASHITLDCGGAVFVGNNYGTGLKTSTSPAVNNVVVKNCEFKNYVLPVYILGQTTLNANHITLDTVKVSGGRDIANILVVGCDDCTFRNIESSDAKNLVSDPLPPHGIYISGGPDLQTGNNIIIENSKFERNAASGIRISDIDGRYHNNLIVRNNIIDNNVDSGLAINACSNCQFTGNKIYSNGNRGISIGTSTITESKGITISGNTIYDNSFDDFILWGSNGVTIKNNIYTRGVLSFSLRTESVKSYSIEENVKDLSINYHTSNTYASDAKLTMSYTGLKKVAFTNNALSFTFTKPYNDVKDLSTNKILSSNTDTYSFNIARNQQVSVGDFVTDPVITTHPPNTPTASITSPDNTVNSDIKCSGGISDPDGGSLTAYVQWMKNDVSFRIDTVTQQSGTTVTNTLSKSSLSVGDKWTCRIRVYDGTDYSAWTTSNLITVLPAPTINEPPNTPTAFISSSDNTVNSDIKCSGYVSDPNGGSLTVSVQWMKNDVSFRIDTLNNQASGSTISNILSKSDLSVGDKWTCRIRAYDGTTYSAWTTSNLITVVSPPIVNRAPNDPTVSITSSDNTVNSDIKCSGGISDPDGGSLTAYVQWLKNDVSFRIDTVTQQSGTTVTNTLSKSSLSVGDKWGCRIRTYDGSLYSNWIASSNINIQSATPVQVPPVLNSITAYSYDSTVDNDVLCMLNINDANNDAMTVTLHWYKNGVFDRAVTIYNQKSGDVVEPLNKNQLSSGDTWQCRARIYDSKEYSDWSSSNILTIGSVPVNEPENVPASKPKSGGGGGGSSSSIPSQVTSPIIVQEPVVEEPVVLDNPQSDDTSISVTTQSVDISEQPVQEENSITGNAVLENTAPSNGIWVLLFGIMMSGLFIFTYKKQIVVATEKYLPVVKEKVLLAKDKVVPLVKDNTAKVIIFVKDKIAVPVDQKALYYMLKKLNDGYSYEAIGEVLKKKGYSERFVNHHTKMLVAHGHQPFIRHPGPLKYSIPQSKKAKLVNEIQEYTRIHIHEGFRLDEIKQVLLYSGHPFDLIEEAIHG